MNEEKFNPNNHLIQLKSKNGTQDYLPVQYRLVWFRELCPEGTIETELIHFDPDRETTSIGYEWNEEKRRSEKVTKHANGFAMFKATIHNSKGGSATAHGSEGAADFMDYIEKAETKAVGRALAMLSFGTQFAPDLDEQHRLVDTPVEHPPLRHTQDVKQAIDEMKPSVKQVEDLRLLCRHLGKQIAKPKTWSEAKKMVEELQAEYEAMIAKGRAS